MCKADAPALLYFPQNYNLRAEVALEIAKGHPEGFREGAQGGDIPSPGPNGDRGGDSPAPPPYPCFPETESPLVSPESWRLLGVAGRGPCSGPGLRQLGNPPPGLWGQTDLQRQIPQGRTRPGQWGQQSGSSVPPRGQTLRRRAGDQRCRYSLPPNHPARFTPGGHWPVKLRKSYMRMRLRL